MALLIVCTSVLAGCYVWWAMMPSYVDEHAKFKSLLKKERDQVLVPYTERKIEKAASEKRL